MQDLSPVIKLLAWLDTVSDERFDTELADWIDVPSFAKYVVTQDLMDNFDDMAGPGRNFLLWYDLEVEKFTVITWDMNLVLVGLGDTFRRMLNMGGAPSLPGAPPPTPEAPPAAGLVPPPEPPLAAANAVRANDTDTEPGATPADAPPGPPPGGRTIRFGNSLKDKFIASEAFADEIASARNELLEFWFTSGLASQRLAELSKSVPVSDRLTREDIELQVAGLEKFISEIK